MSLETALKAFVSERMEQTKMLVWYDEGATLSVIIEKVIPKSTELIVYKGSYIQIREEIEKDGNLSKSRVIYIPQPPLKQSWLRDYELFGEKIELDLPKILREIFQLKSTLESNTLLSAANCRRLTPKWNQVIGEVEPPITLEQLAEALVSILFDQTTKFDPKIAVLQFLQSPEELQPKLEKSGLKNVFLKILRRNGLPAIDELDPKKISASILLSELLANAEIIPDTPYQSILPEANFRKYWAGAVHEWAQNADYLGSFFKWSGVTEIDYDIKDAIKGHAGIEKSEAFQAVDQALLEEVQCRIQNNAVDGLIENATYIKGLAKERLKKIWSREGKTREWSTLEKIIFLLEKIEQSFQDIKCETILSKYFDDLWIIDQRFREVSSHVQELWGSLDPSIEDSVKERYQKWLQKTNDAFAESLQKALKWPIQQYRSQTTFWKDFIKPREKTCLFVLDALRYELQKRFITNLESTNHKAKLTPMLSSLPPITEVGMTAILPNAKLDINLSKDKIQVFVDGQLIENKQDRLEWIKKKYNGKVVAIDLSDLRTEKQNSTGNLSDADLLIISDLDIDKAGAYVSNDLLVYFDQLVDRITNAIDTVAALGFNKVVIVTDHGFLSIPKPESVKVIKDFSEKGLVATRRFAIGKPQSNKDAIVLQLKNLGYGSQDDILLPRGLAFLPRQGPKENYIHGGLSLQECCIGVIEVETKTKKKRVSVTAEVPEPISTIIFRIKLIPKAEELFPVPRTVKANLYFNGENIGASEQVDISNQTKELTMKLNKTKGVDRVDLKIEDVLTKETVFQKEIRVALEEYEDLF